MGYDYIVAMNCSDAISNCFIASEARCHMARLTEMVITSAFRRTMEWGHWKKLWIGGASDRNHTRTAMTTRSKRLCRLNW